MSKHKFLNIVFSIMIVASLMLSGSFSASAQKAQLPSSAGAAGPASPTDETKVPHYFGPYPNWANSPLTMPDVQVVITGNGTGATAEATVGADGAITAITVTNPGSGYTNAKVDYHQHERVRCNGQCDHRQERLGRCHHSELARHPATPPRPLPSAETAAPRRLPTAVSKQSSSPMAAAAILSRPSNSTCRTVRVACRPRVTPKWMSTARSQLWLWTAPALATRSLRASPSIMARYLTPSQVQLWPRRPLPCPFHRLGWMRLAPTITKQPDVTISDPTGTGATATAVLDNGIISAIMIKKPGSGYIIPGHAQICR